MPQSVTFRPIVEDQVAVARSNFLRGLTKPRFRWRLLAMLMLGVMFGGGISWLDAGEIEIESIALTVGAVLVWLSAVLTSVYLLIPRRSGRLFRQQRSLAHDFTLDWDEAGLAQRWSEGALRTPWSEYNDWFENKRVFAFGLNDLLYHFVPKRAMTPEQCESLRAAAAVIVRPSVNA